MKRNFIWFAALLIPVIAVITAINCGGDKSTGLPCYTLALQVQGSGHAEAEPGLSCYHDTTHITLEADPEPGWSFDDWSGDYSGNNNPVTITLSRNSTITANFEQLSYTLSISVNPPAGGSVTKNPDQASYHFNDVVTLTAVPAGSFEFISWTGDASGNNPTVDITITGNMSATANFGQEFTQENEPDCGTNYVDNFNGGCNSSPPQYSQILSGQAIEGTSGTFLFQGSEYRDTDWFRYVAGGSRNITFKGIADFDLQLYILDISDGCDNVQVIDSDIASYGDTAYTSANVVAGTYVMWVGPSDYTGWPCPVDYRIWFTATTVTTAKESFPVDTNADSNWGNSLIKNYQEKIE